MKRGSVAVLIAIAALPLFAQTPPRDFAKGPAQWLFTSGEQKAWRAVQTDDQAIDFIDLFWARRDPTPGTPLNENRREFDSRVQFADKNFKEGNLRGALTERGRALVLLGFPANWTAEKEHTSGQTGMDRGVLGNTGAAADGRAIDPTGGRELASKDTWVYTHEQAVKFGTPKLEIVFIHDVGSDRVHRDPQRTDFTMALPGAIKSWIVSPELNAVPEWATSRTRKELVAGTESETVTTQTVKKTQILVPAPQPDAKAAGAGHLILLADPSVLQPQSGGDPFAGVASLSRFKQSQDLGWAAQLCAGRLSGSSPAIRVQIQLEGKDGTVSSDPEDFVPDSIKGAPGCYLVRGSVPLADVDPGPHKFTVTLTAGDRSYNLTRELEVE